MLKPNLRNRAVWIGDNLDVLVLAPIGITVGRVSGPLFRSGLRDSDLTARH